MLFHFVFITIMVLSLSQTATAERLSLRQRVADAVEAWTHPHKISEEGIDDIVPPVNDDFITFKPTLKPTRIPTRAPTSPTMIPTRVPTAPTIIPTMVPTVVPTVAPTLFPSSLTCASNYSYVMDSPTPAPTDSICGCCSRVATRNVTFVSVSTVDGVTTTTVVVSQTFED